MPGSPIRSSVKMPSVPGTTVADTSHRSASSAVTASALSKRRYTGGGSSRRTNGFP